MIIQAILFEVLGSLLLTFLYLTQTEEKTKLSGDPAITTMIISATYAALFAFSISFGVVTGSPFNPAVAFGIFFAVWWGGDLAKYKDFDIKLNLWVIVIFSYLGAILAVILFEFVYKKAMSAVEEEE